MNDRSKPVAAQRYEQQRAADPEDRSPRVDHPHEAPGSVPRGTATPEATLRKGHVFQKESSEPAAGGDKERKKQKARREATSQRKAQSQAAAKRAERVSTAKRGRFSAREPESEESSDDIFTHSGRHESNTNNGHSDRDQQEESRQLQETLRQQKEEAERQEESLLQQQEAIRAQLQARRELDEQIALLQEQRRQEDAAFRHLQSLQRQQQEAQREAQEASRREDEARTRQAQLIASNVELLKQQEAIVRQREALLAERAETDRAHRELKAAEIAREEARAQEDHARRVRELQLEAEGASRRQAALQADIQNLKTAQESLHQACAERASIFHAETMARQDILRGFEFQYAQLKADEPCMRSVMERYDEQWKTLVASCTEILERAPLFQSQTERFRRNLDEVKQVYEGQRASTAAQMAACGEAFRQSGVGTLLGRTVSLMDVSMRSIPVNDPVAEEAPPAPVEVEMLLLEAPPLWTPRPPEDAVSEEELIAVYGRRWQMLKDKNAIPDDSIDIRALPWPIMAVFTHVDLITSDAMEKFLFHPQRASIQGMTAQMVIRQELLRWHPDRFEVQVLPKVMAAHREAARKGAYEVAQVLIAWSVAVGAINVNAG
ncbi:hypothetical protein HGRIS_000387 [Hohenbuehelia grisea]|uniref:Uncharacterized protein n=1 Tax=Hohenbuehelia grisea TaxID=104357 RepID=A0ABR3JR21_9AGAR